MTHFESCLCRPEPHRSAGEDISEQRTIERKISRRAGDCAGFRDDISAGKCSKQRKAKLGSFRLYSDAILRTRYYSDQMSKHRESLYQNLVNGKLPHNLSWSEAVDLVKHLGEVQPHGNDEFVFRIGSQRVVFKQPHTHDLGVEEVSRLRKFLREAGSNSQAEEPVQPFRVVVVIDHHAAHVYQDVGGSRPAKEHKVQPYDPFHFHHHLIHRKEAHYRGERVPEEDSFYEEIAKDIAPANEIVLIGHATGKSNAADFLKEYLKTHHSDIDRRVIATESADLSAVTEPQIEALAKLHMIPAA